MDISSDFVSLLVLIGFLGVLSGILLLSFLDHRENRRQTRAIADQLGRAHETVQAQNLLAAVSLLREQDFRSAMMAVRNKIRGRSPSAWQAAETYQVLLVCSTYNLLGTMVRSGLVDGEVFLSHWGASVVDAFESLSEFLRERQTHNPAYCGDFSWLYLQAKPIAGRDAPSREMPMPAGQPGVRRLG